MKYLLIPAIILLIISCEDDGSIRNRESRQDTTAEIPNTVLMEENDTEPQRYHNNIFREVLVEKMGPKRWKITGEARVFEATFSYYIEDGHNQLSKGTAMADKGAPDWGHFTFEAEADSIKPHTHPHLILYEVSAKDGRPTNELAIPLQGAVQ